MTPPRPTASEDEIRLDRLRQRRRRYPLWRLLWANLRDDLRLLRQAWFPLAMLLLVLAGGTAYLLLLYFPTTCGASAGCAPDPGLAFYEVLQLLVFQSGLDFPADPLGRLIFFALPLLGLFFLLQSAIDLGRLLFDKSASPQAWQRALASTFGDHVIVCGIGRVGYRVVLQLLDAGHEVVAINSDWGRDFVTTIIGLRVPVIQGDARDPEVLRQAGLGRARAIIAAVNDDLVNIEIGLAARRRRPELPAVLRIYSRELDLNLERSFGPNSAFSSSALAAPTFAAAAVSRAIVHVLSTPAGLVGLAELTVAAASRLCGPAGKLEREQGVRLLRLRDGSGRERRPGPAERIGPGDVVLALGRLAELDRLRAANLAGEAPGLLQALPPQQLSPERHTVILCGLGKVGTQVARLLLGSQARPDLVLICTPETPERLTAELAAAGARVLRGDAREPELLRQAGLDRAYSLAALHGDDLVNLQIGLAARRLAPEVHLVLRVFSDVLAERLAAIFGINTAYSTSALAAPTLAAAAILPRVGHAVDLGQRLFGTLSLELAAGDGLSGRSVAELREQSGLLVVALSRSGQTSEVPDLDERLAPGDRLLLLGELGQLARWR